MKRLLISLMLVLGFATASYAAIPVPKDSNNLQIGNPLWAGAASYDMGTATGTTDVLVATGKGIIFGVIVSSSTGASSDFITFRDSATANHTSGVLFVGAVQNSATVQPFYPVSVKFVNGISATMNAATGNNEHWTILYRLQSDQN